MSREREPAEIADVFKAIEGIAGEPVARVGDAEAKEVPGSGRKLGTDEDEHSIAVALERLGIEVVVIGDHHEAGARRASRADDVLGGPPAVGEGGVNVDDSRNADVAVARRLSDDRERPPESDAHEQQCEHGEEDQQRDAPAPGLRGRA